MNGFLNRLDLLEETRMTPIRDVDYVDFPVRLMMQLTKPRSIKAQRMPWGKGAEEIWQAEIDRVYSQTDERKIKLWARTPEKI